MPDQILTPRSYGASAWALENGTPRSYSPSSPFSQIGSPLPLSRRASSPLFSSPSPREQLSTPRSFNSALSSGPPSPFPLGPLPPNRLRGHTHTAGAAGASIKTGDRKKAVPFAYVWPVQHRPTIEHDDFTDLEIPTVDLSSLTSDDDAARKQMVAKVRAACLDWGFFHAINHGVPGELLDRVQKQAQKFFALPKEEKQKVSKAPGRFTGYGHAAVKPTDSQPWSEGFYLANDDTVEGFQQTLWPNGDNNDFTDSYKEYNEKVEKLAQQLMDVIVEGLEVTASHFQRYIEKASGLLRWNHYPPCPQPHKALGMSAHTDFNLLTVLHQGDIGGLQVQKDGEWVAVKPHRDALAVNIGDTLQVLTNALYKSVPHRAVVNKYQARISLAYFFAPQTGLEIVPSPELVDRTTQSSNYKPFTIEEYLAVKKGQLLNTLEHFSLQPLLQRLSLHFEDPTPIPESAVSPQLIVR